MPECKFCKSQRIVKSGFVRSKQRYKCKDCGKNFVVGDERTNRSIVAKKALCVLLYSLGKGSFNMIAHLLDTWPSLVYRWVKGAGVATPEPEVSGEITEMEFDEMWHFLGQKNESCGLSRRLTVAQGELSHGLWVSVILQHSSVSMRKSSI
jgi:transposase-like protein